MPSTCAMVRELNINGIASGTKAAFSSCTIGVEMSSGRMADEMF
jgi:hypothetical protein